MNEHPGLARHVSSKRLVFVGVDDIGGGVERPEVGQAHDHTNHGLAVTGRDVDEQAVVLELAKHERFHGVTKELDVPLLDERNRFNLGPRRAKEVVVPALATG